MSDDDYPPEAIRVLAGMEPPRRPAGFVEDRYRPEDGPGASGPRVELTVRVIVGTERSTVIVADAVTGRALATEVVAHEDEARTAAEAVGIVVRDARSIQGA